MAGQFTRVTQQVASSLDPSMLVFDWSFTKFERSFTLQIWQHFRKYPRKWYRVWLKGAYGKLLELYFHAKVREALFILVTFTMDPLFLDGCRGLKCKDGITWPASVDATLISASYDWVKSLLWHSTRCKYAFHNIRKSTFRYLRPAKIQISLRIRAVWSESSMGAF